MVRVSKTVVFLQDTQANNSPNTNASQEYYFRLSHRLSPSKFLAGALPQKHYVCKKCFYKVLTYKNLYVCPLCHTKFTMNEPAGSLQHVLDAVPSPPAGSISNNILKIGGAKKL